MTAQGTETRQGQDRGTGLGRNDDGPVGNADAPMTDPNNPPNTIHTDLLPCPFCGSDAVLISERPDKSWPCYVSCNGCSAMTRTADGPEAKAAWNTRTPSPTIILEMAEENQALREALRAADVVIKYAAERLWNGRPSAVRDRPVEIDQAIRSVGAALGANPAFVASPSNPQAVSTEGFNRGEA